MGLGAGLEDQVARPLRRRAPLRLVKRRMRQQRGDARRLVLGLNGVETIRLVGSG